jgi:putative polyketide hydroxylase
LDSIRPRDHIKTPVLIIGAGPVGMMTALLLARQGIRSVLIERRSELTAHPKGRGFNARSMELFRQCGMLPEMIAAQPSTDSVANVAIGTGISDPELRITPFFGAHQGVREFSPAINVVGGQDIVELVVVSQLRRYGAVHIIYDCQLDAITQSTDGVTASAKRSDGTVLNFQANYVIAADGARSPTSQLCGRTIEQRSPVLNQNVNILFRADLSLYVDKFKSCAFLTILSKDTPGLRGILAIMSTVRSPDERTYNVVLRPDETPDMITRDNAADWLRREIGLPDGFPIEIMSISPWDASARMIDQFRDGRIFFVGDAARTIPPAGALGMNTGLIDANNAAWRVAMAVKGFASDRFLEDYATERKAHSEMIVEAAVGNMRGAVDGGPGRPGAPPGGPPPAGTHSPGSPPEPQSPIGTYFGFTYASKSVIPDGTAAQPFVPHQYIPTATPGARAPHIWLDPRYELSVLDLFGSGFILLAADRNDWAIAAERIGFESGFPIRSIDIRAEVRTLDIWHEWMALYGVGEDGAVLVRPDGMVAWRSANAADDAHGALTTALETIIGTKISSGEQA